MSNCQYIGEANAGVCCNKTAIKDKSYCEEHAAIVYQKGTALRKRHRDIKKAETIHFLSSLMNEAIAELEAEGFDCYGRTA